MSGTETDETRMRAMVTFAVEHVAAGGLPFVGQLVGADGDTSGYGVNLVRETGDPTAHAEIVAMRSLLRTGRSLAGLTLLATGEPCGLCYEFAAAHEITSFCFAVSQDEAARYGFDYRDPLDRHRRPAGAHLLPVDDRLAPFAAWLRRKDYS